MYTVLNRLAGDCKSVPELITLYQGAEDILTKQLEEKIRPLVMLENQTDDE